MIIDHAHRLYTGYPLIDQVLRVLIDLFLAPGNTIMRSFAATPWGQQWGVTAQWPLTALAALFFWCILFSLLAAANDHIRRFIERNRTSVKDRKNNVG